MYRYYFIRKEDWLESSYRAFYKMSKYKFEIEMSIRNGKFFGENSPLNGRNLKGSQMT